MRIVDCLQGSPEWYAARIGKITASSVSDVMSRSRDGKSEGTTRRNYRAKLVCERLTGVACESGFTSKAMADGKDREELARAAYEIETGRDVVQVGTVLHPTIANFQASPDGIVGDDGLLEIKCGYPSTHYEWARAGRVPAEYIKQMNAQLSCCDRKWVDFASFSLDFPEPYQLYIVRLYRDSASIAAMEDEVIKFDAEVEQEMVSMEEIQWVKA